LTHPNIVTIYRRGETAKGQLWIAMQFVDGTDADAALKAATMNPQRAVRIIGEVARALDYAHRHNVVHRDVKPANFLLAARRDAAERVLLGDFGIARGLDDIGLTATGSMLATMAYAAPEVLAGRPFDGRADVYSLGCSLFRLLTGTMPFPSGNGPAAVMMAHLHQPPPRLTDRMPDLPSAFDAVIATAIAKDPMRRFATAAEPAEAATTALRDAPSGVSRVALPARSVGAAPSTDRGWWYPPSSAPTKATTEPRSVQPGHRFRWVAATLAAIAAVVAGAAGLILSGRTNRAVAPPTPSATVAPTAAPTPVPVAELAKLLLDTGELSIRVNASQIQVVSTSAALLDSRPTSWPHSAMPRQPGHSSAPSSSSGGPATSGRSRRAPRGRRRILWASARAAPTAST
jgi:serine/threonine-protein kinase